MKKSTYHIKEFARLTSVTVRTLRYYDKIGLLVPSLYDDSGYKLYTDEDMISIQSIQSLKFLGFSLKEIQTLMTGNKNDLKEKLLQQKAMLRAKKVQLDQIMDGIERVEASLQSESFNFKTMIELIKLIQNNLKPEWVNQYLTTEERKTMRALAKQAYPKEVLLTFAARGWTEEDHKQHFKDYQTFRTSLTRLVSDGYTPESREAQELTEFLINMNNRYSQGDPKIKEGMKKSWETFNALPEDKKPKMYVIPDEERVFLKQASIFYHRNRTSY